MNLAKQVKQAGVIGAGGAGFPTHVKLTAKVEQFLVNGAECEPLMHKDRELMTHFAGEIIEGIKLAYKAVGAKKAVIGIKSKNRDALKAIRAAINDPAISIHEFGDFYPVGDEYELVYGITGRHIPPQGLPLDVGCVVNNVETVYNIYKAANNEPVTKTFLTITGLVKNPVSTRVPVGMTVKDVLELAGGPAVSEFGMMESGLMMGKLVTDINQPVTKTTGGIIVLPADHNLITRYSKTQKEMDRIGHSACDQCSYCTELCPRYLLGYDIQPHLVMRSLGFNVTGPQIWNQYALLCCQCGICTLYACPEALYPRETCVKGIQNMRESGGGKWEGNKEIKTHPMHDHRRLPLKQLMNRLGVTKYEAHAGYSETRPEPDKVFIPLNQNVGAPAEAVVNKGDVVKKGQLVGRIPADKLGANVHASIDGRIADVTDTMIMIERNK
ncbi:4Fe-4S dicluster domain-containing protein [candidate division KSB1 bacterium]|nr:4Fe-4S dicluster domain-containing protein [candidate division KSB1 bacterium]